jgi:hypothetical protein
MPAWMEEDVWPSEDEDDIDDLNLDSDAEGSVDDQEGAPAAEESAEPPLEAGNQPAGHLQHPPLAPLNHPPNQPDLPGPIAQPFHHSLPKSVHPFSF